MSQGTPREYDKWPKVKVFEIYRYTTLGLGLKAALEEMLEFQQISPSTALRVLLQFDRAINAALANKVRARINFKANKLNTYRFCDNVWTFLMTDVEFKEVQDFAQVDKLKIVACDGRGPGPGGASGGTAND